MVGDDELTARAAGAEVADHAGDVVRAEPARGLQRIVYSAGAEMSAP